MAGHGKMNKKSRMFYRHKPKDQPAMTIAQLEHAISLKKFDIQNYAVFLNPSKPTTISYGNHLKAELRALEDQLLIAKQKCP